jgi:biotin carboxylase
MNPTETRDTILTINVVEPGLVRAVNMHSERLGRPLKGLVLVHRGYADQPNRPKDKTGLFEEIICDFDDYDELQTVLKPYSDRIAAATCRYEEAVQGFRKVIPFLPYIHTPSPISLLWSTEKPMMRDRLHAYDPSLVPKYQYMEEQDLDRAAELISDFNYPLIIKPSGLSKALLVDRCDNEAEFKENLARTFEVIHQVYARDQYPGKPAVLVEEMIQGDMFSVDVYVSHDGRFQCLPVVRVITAHAVGLPGFYGHQREVPAGLSDEAVQQAHQAAIAAVRALNLSSTTAHVELFQSPTGWKVIELAARIGGYRDLLYREAYGYEHFYNDLALRMGLEPEKPGKLLKHAVVVNIYAKEEGVIEAIEGVEAAKQLDSMVYIKQHAQPGTMALFATNGGDLIVDGVLSNADPEQLQRDVAKVRELVTITVQP